jgi:hypothetical protein
MMRKMWIGDLVVCLSGTYGYDQEGSGYVEPGSIGIVVGTVQGWGLIVLFSDGRTVDVASQDMTSLIG